jgi:hypothetical protein
MRPPLATILVLAAAAAAPLAACTAPQREAAPCPAAPRRRDSGPRSIPFAGGDPASRGWVKVDDLLWLEAAHAERFRRGEILLDGAYVPFATSDAAPKSPEGGYVLRTDHLLLRTNVTLARARTLAEEGERHIRRVLALLGDPLDLRMPEDPLRVVVAARRSEFAALLARAIPAAVDWNAFYEPSKGTVYAADEAYASNGLPLVADLRHEMTHAILDLGRPEAGRGGMYMRPQFWIWEGIALWTEGLGDPPSTHSGAARFDRFRRRAEWGDVVPLAELQALRQDAFLGRHYDETAVFMAWLMEADGGARRAGAYALLAKVMDGEGETGDFEALVGLPVDEAERRWKAASIGVPGARPSSAPGAAK